MGRSTKSKWRPLCYPQLLGEGPGNGQSYSLSLCLLLPFSLSLSVSYILLAPWMSPPAVAAVPPLSPVFTCCLLLLRLLSLPQPPARCVSLLHLFYLPLFVSLMRDKRLSPFIMLNVAAVIICCRMCFSYCYDLSTSSNSIQAEGPWGSFSRLSLRLFSV